MSYSKEFKTVELIVNSSAETRGVDAFALSLIKAERQIRKLVTHLVYQFPCFGSGDRDRLKETLYSNRTVYFEGFIKGFDAIYPISIKNLVGTEHDLLLSSIFEATKYRNKIFHGQLTQNYLTRDQLFHYVTDIRIWCNNLAQSTLTEFRYDGFARNSFRKSEIPELWKCFKVEFRGIEDYANFIRRRMAR